MLVLPTRLFGHSEFYTYGPPNTFLIENALKKTTEYFLKFIFFIWKYNPSI